MCSLSAGMKDARGAGTAHIHTLWLFDNFKAVSGVFQRAKHCPVYAVYFLLVYLLILSLLFKGQWSFQLLWKALGRRHCDFIIVKVAPLIDDRLGEEMLSDRSLEI